MFRLWLIPVVSSPLTFPGQAHGSWGLVSAVMACIYAGFHISITATAAEIGGFKMKLKLESGYRVCMRKHIWIPVEKVLGGGSCIRSADWQVLRSGVKVGATSGPAASRALAKWFSSGGRIRDIRFEEVFHNSLIINDSSLEILMSHKWCIGLWWGRSTITSLNVTGLFIHGNKVFVIINVSWYLAIKSAVEMIRRWRRRRRHAFIRPSSLCRRCEAAENEFKHFTFHFLLSLTSVTRRVSSLCYINWIFIMWLIVVPLKRNDHI